jgi:hypothetical protein
MNRDQLRSGLLAVALALAACGGASSGIGPDRQTDGDPISGGAASGQSIGNGGAASGPEIGNGGAASGPAIGNGGAASGPGINSGGNGGNGGGSGGSGGGSGGGGPACFTSTSGGTSVCACFSDIASGQGALGSGATQVASCSSFGCCCSGTGAATCECFQPPSGLTCDQLCGAESATVLSSCP